MAITPVQRSQRAISRIVNRVKAHKGTSLLRKVCKKGKKGKKK